MQNLMTFTHSEQSVVLLVLGERICQIYIFVNIYMYIYIFHIAITRLSEGCRICYCFFVFWMSWLKDRYICCVLSSSSFAQNDALASSARVAHDSRS